MSDSDLLVVVLTYYRRGESGHVVHGVGTRLDISPHFPYRLACVMYLRPRNLLQITL